MSKYSSVGPVVKNNALNCFKDPLEACAVASSLNRELISHLMFHSNKNAHGKVAPVNGTFVGYKRANITVSEKY